MPTLTKIASGDITTTRARTLAQEGGSNNGVMYQWGRTIQFAVWPMNVHEFDHETATDWAQKQIAGAAIYREWVGENDEHIYFRGRLYPTRMEGAEEDINVFDTCRRTGLAQLLVRGDGRVLGWFVCEKLVRAHTFLDWRGYGQQVAFEALLARIPAPSAETVIGNELRMLGGNG